MKRESVRALSGGWIEGKHSSVLSLCSPPPVFGFLYHEKDRSGLKKKGCVCCRSSCLFRDDAAFLDERDTPDGKWQPWFLPLDIVGNVGNPPRCVTQFKATTQVSGFDCWERKSQPGASLRPNLSVTTSHTLYHTCLTSLHCLVARHRACITHPGTHLRTH